MNSSGKNIGVGCHFLLQEIFLIQGSNPSLLHLLHWQVRSLTLVLPGKPMAECCIWLILLKLSQDRFPKTKDIHNTSRFKNFWGAHILSFTTDGTTYQFGLGALFLFISHSVFESTSFSFWVKALKRKHSIMVINFCKSWKNPLSILATTFLSQLFPSSFASLFELCAVNNRRFSCPWNSKKKKVCVYMCMCVKERVFVFAVVATDLENCLKFS